LVIGDPELGCSFPQPALVIRETAVPGRRGSRLTSQLAAQFKLGASVSFFDGSTEF
jgi:hypothetical protein